MADLFQFEPHGLVRNIQRESSRVAPMEIRPPGFLIRGWSHRNKVRGSESGVCILRATVACGLWQQRAHAFVRELRGGG